MKSISQLLSKMQEKHNFKGYIKDQCLWSNTRENFKSYLVMPLMLLILSFVRRRSFKNGLRPELRRAFTIRKLTTYGEVLERALLLAQEDVNNRLQQERRKNT